MIIIVNTRKYQGASRAGFEVGQEITPSVISTARVLKVKPVDLAEAILDDEANSQYRSEVTEALQRLAVKRAVADTARDAVASIREALGLKG